jgi:hypothetical protein
MPHVLPSSDFYAHHSPFGAFASFSVGRHGRKGGFGLELGGPADQDVYVAIARPGEPVRALPFYSGADARGAEAYTGESAAATSAASGTSLAWRPFAESEIQRAMGWASDTWTAGDLTFRLLTPFDHLPEIEGVNDEALRRHLLPALLAEVSLDNTGGDGEAFAFFGVGAGDPLRPLSDATAGRLRGMARETQWGFAVVPDNTHAAEDVREVASWGLLEAVARASSDVVPPLHRLANRGGVLLRVPPGQRRTYTLALGFFRGGVVTSGIAGSYLYTRLFPDLEAVLGYAIEHAAELRETAERRDAELDRATHLNDERRFLLAHATHSYHGSTMLLHDERAVLPRVPFHSAGSRADLPGDANAAHRPLWAVNEGEYRMLNTFDLTVDHAFWELRFHPWTLRNTMDLFVARYSYLDEAQDATDPRRPRFPGGISFTHDMGVANQFSAPGYSSYERPDLDDCFSYMTQEQLCNWCLCAALYGLPNRLSAVHLPGGDPLWLAARRPVLHACLDSLINRDGPAGLRDGVMSLDAARCASGQEITTYDSLDASLGQARANGYLAVKTWAAYRALGRCLAAVGDDDEAALADEQAALAARTIAGHFDAESNAFPAVFEAGNEGYASRIIPAIEGSVYPFVLGDAEAIAETGPFGEIVTLLKRHLETVLVPGLCVDPASGGWKLSSSSDNTWMSKIFLCQFVAESVLGVPLADAFDAAHARWQRDGNSRDWAFTDQVRSSDGYDLGSRYYPRGVTAILWLLGASLGQK